MCIIYTVRFLCQHLVHLDNPPVTRCEKSLLLSTTHNTTAASKKLKPKTARRNTTTTNQLPLDDSPPIYCPIPLLPTIIQSDQVCNRCSAGLLAYARRVYYFEVGCMMLKLPTRLDQEEKLYFAHERDGKGGGDHSLFYYRNNIVDRILPPGLLLDCWKAWRADRERFRALGVCGGDEGELGRGFRLDDHGDGEGDGDGYGEGMRKGGSARDSSSSLIGAPALTSTPTPTPAAATITGSKAGTRKRNGTSHSTVIKPPTSSNSTPKSSPHHHQQKTPQPTPSTTPPSHSTSDPTSSVFPTTYFFDDFLGGIIPTANLEAHAETAREKALQRKLLLLDAIVEARCLEMHSMDLESDASCGIVGWLLPLRKARAIRRWCASFLAKGGVGEGFGGDGEWAEEEECEIVDLYVEIKSRDHKMGAGGGDVTNGNGNDEDIRNGDKEGDDGDVKDGDEEEWFDGEKFEDVDVDF